MDPQQVISFLFNFNYSQSNLFNNQISTYILILNKARSNFIQINKKPIGFTIDDLKLSSSEDNIPVNFYSKWLKAIAEYLVVADLIGTLLSNKTVNKFSKNSIEHVMIKFSNLSIKEISSIKGLRNSLVHTFSLTNKSEIYKLVDFGALVSFAQKSYRTSRN